MIENAWLYFGIVFILGSTLWAVERRIPLKLFTWLPAIVLIYLLAITLSQSGLFAKNAEQTALYSSAKAWLLPMMLFVMMLRVDLGAFAQLGTTLLIAYLGAVFSLSIAFFTVFALFGFGREAAGVFGALSGSWTGGTANMLAVAGAMNVSASQLGPALIVDSVLYTLWVSMLLLLVPFATRFDRWSRAKSMLPETHILSEDHASLFALLSLLMLAAAVTFALHRLTPLLPFFPASTWTVLLATLIGLAGSFSPMRRLGGATALASFMLYILIAFVGSHASLHGFGDVPRYLAAGAAILLIHAALMLLLARLFQLSLFDIGIASLSNIGGIASAPILAAAYNRRFVGAAVVMAVMGYLMGTIIGLLIAAGLTRIAG